MPPAYVLPTGGAAVSGFYGARSELADITWLEVSPADRVLDVGCGTGELTRRVADRLPRGMMVCVDSAPQTVAGASFVLADAHHLPLRDQVFDVAYCHTLLMHLSSPVDCLREMQRVTKVGGPIVALSEGVWARPCTAPRCDAIEELRLDLLANLRRSGANPLIGLELGNLFTQAGLGDVICEQVGETIELQAHEFITSPLHRFALQLVPEERRAQWASSVAHWAAAPASRLTLPSCFRAKGRVR